MRRSTVIVHLVLAASTLSAWAAEPCSLSIVTQPPFMLTGPGGSRPTISVEVGGTPPFFYQWFWNDMPIDGATNACYQSPPLFGDYVSSRYYVQVSNACDQIQSVDAIVQVYQDPIPPWVERAVALATNRVAVMFGLPVMPGTATNYVFDPARTVTDVRRNQSDPSLVELTLATETPLSVGQMYRLRVRGLTDPSGNHLNPTLSEVTLVGQDFESQSTIGRLEVVWMGSWWYDHKLILLWAGGGILQGAVTLDGAWEDLATATSPYVVVLSQQVCRPPAEFFRVLLEDPGPNKSVERTGAPPLGAGAP